ncbi:phosphatidylinositol 3-kinase [Pelomyxa schiedti]|nr:phosphatidylinositol 3-kinase [Pelomyxa schiedti]
MSMRTPPPPSPSIKNATAHVPVPTTSSTSSPAETSAAELEAKRNRILKTVPILQASHRQLATFFDQCSTTPPKVGVDDLVWRPKRVYDPLFGAVIPIDKIEVIKVFDSQAKPCLMSISFSTLMPPKTFIYKTGDDLRKDLAVEVMFEVFNSLWDCSGLTIKPHAFTYYVVPTGPNRGLIEFIENSVPVTKFVWENISTLSEQDLDRLIATAAGGYVAVFVLGIRDRHRDNMLIKNNNIFFQIDFGYVFNMKPWFDANRLAFASEFKAKLIERKAWERFIRICIEGWLILRRCSGLLINLCERLFAGILEDPVRMCSSCLHDAFFLDQCEPDACISVNEMLESGVTSVKKMIKDIQHNFLTGTTHTTTAPSSIAPPATTTTNNNNTSNTRAQPTGSQDTSRTGH